MLIFLLIGQSNMVGRGPLDADAGVPDLPIYRFTPQGVCEKAADPLHSDGPKKGGVGPGMSFAQAVASSMPGTEIGLIPCALGDTPLARWVKSGDLFEMAVRRTRTVRQSGTLAAILWHQGESDARSLEDSGTYEDRLRGMILDVRHDLGAADIPFIAGELGTFLSAVDFPGAALINASLRGLGGRVPNYACVSSGALTDKGDHKHFDTPSQRELGRRYASAFLNNAWAVSVGSQHS